MGECPLLAISGHLLVRRFCSVRLARIVLPRASAICLCACHKCARCVAFRLEPTTTPAQVARPARRSEMEKEAGPFLTRPVTEKADPTRVGKVACAPPRATSRPSTVARNDHVTPPSVYWQDAHAHSCGKERPWHPEQVAWASRAWEDRSRGTGQKSPDCKWSAIAPGADIGPRYVCFEG